MSASSVTGRRSVTRTARGVTPPIDSANIAKPVPSTGSPLTSRLTRQPGHGFTYGVNGGRYNGVCSADLEPEFVASYNVGYQLYSLRAAVSSANSAIYAKQGELKSTEKRIVAIGVELISDETTTEQRVELLAEMKDLSERTGELESEIEFLVAERARAEQELQYFEQTVAAEGY